MVYNSLFSLTMKNYILQNNGTRLYLYEISEKQAYEWVRTKHWNLQMFSAWFEAKLQKNLAENS